MNSLLSMSIYHLAKKVSNYKYHQIHKKAAEELLIKLEAKKGKINKKLIRLSDEYAKEILGWKGFAPWLYVYCAVNNCFKEGWIPDNYFAKVVLPVIDGGYGKVSDFRPLSRHLIGSEVFPDLGYFVNGLFFSKNYEVLNEEKLKDFLFKDYGFLVFKTDKSLQRKGFFLFEKESFEVGRIKKLGNGVFQYFINQHPFFSEFMPASVSTIRITSYYDDNGIVSVKACYLRIGRAEEHNVKWVSNIVVPVDPETGELNSTGFFMDFDSIDRHPDTHTVFAKRYIPSFNNCVSTVIKLHRQMPFARCIGWDLIVDKDNNVKVMEWNGYHTDIKVHEALQGPCFTGLGWEEIWKK